ncbi:hypothetical protein Tco_0337188 [Tanacetum coccineum]
MLYKLPNNNLRTSSNSKNKTKDTTPRYNNDNQSGQFGNQRTMTVAGTRETVGSPVVQQIGIQCFNCKRDWPLAKRNAGRPKRDERLMNRNREATFTVFMAKIQEVLPEESTSTEQPLEQDQTLIANPRYLKKAQSEKPCLYEIPYDTSDLANRFGPNKEETMTLVNESR